MNNIDNLIANLNKEQKEAVLSTEGPNLIVAGAGSGKTRVLTTRLIHIIDQKKAWPNQILCVTFTNKAAKEMQNRVMQYVKGIKRCRACRSCTCRTCKNNTFALSKRSL